MTKYFRKSGTPMRVLRDKITRHVVVEGLFRLLDLHMILNSIQDLYRNSMFI